MLMADSRMLPVMVSVGEDLRFMKPPSDCSSDLDEQQSAAKKRNAIGARLDPTPAAGASAVVSTGLHVMHHSSGKVHNEMMSSNLGATVHGNQ